MRNLHGIANVKRGRSTYIETWKLEIEICGNRCVRCFRERSSRRKKRKESAAASSRKARATRYIGAAASGITRRAAEPRSGGETKHNLTPSVTTVPYRTYIPSLLTSAVAAVECACQWER